MANFTSTGKNVQLAEMFYVSWQVPDDGRLRIKSEELQQTVTKDVLSTKNSWHFTGTTKGFSKHVAGYDRMNQKGMSKLLKKFILKDKK